MEEIFLNQGVLGALVLFFMIVCYRYINFKLAAMREEFDHKLKDKRYVVKGEILVTGDKQLDINLSFDGAEQTGVPLK